MMGTLLIRSHAVLLGIFFGHTHEDEWYYIVKAGKNAVLLYHDGDAQGNEGTVAQEMKLETGDFIGFPAGVKIGHGLRSGDEELIYLVGGSREPLDTSYYPLLGRWSVSSRTGPTWWVDEKDVKS